MRTKEEIRRIASEPEIDDMRFASASDNRNPSVPSG